MKRMLSIVCVVSVAFLVTGCGSPKLVVPKSLAFKGEFGGSNGEPIRATKLNLQVEPSDQSVRWTAKASAPWLKVSPSSGAAPAEVQLEFDVKQMPYGDSVATVDFFVGETTSTLAVAYSLRGNLVVTPSQVIELIGKVGDKSSRTVEIVIDSPGKPGLDWKLNFTDPWIVADSMQGTTPATVKVASSLANLTQSVTGRLSVESAQAWKGSPTVLPISTTILNVNAVRTQIKAKEAKIAAELEGLSEELQNAFKAAVDKEDVKLEDVESACKDTGRRIKQLARRVEPLIDELEAFLQQMKPYEEECDFKSVLAGTTSVRARLEKGIARAVAFSDSVRVNDATVEADGEWQRVGALRAERGDVLFLECTGTWTYGFFSTCDASGVASGEEWRVVKKHGTGALIIRVGGTTICSGGADGDLTAETVDVAGGTVEARCNDKDYSNNSGQIRIRVLKIHIPEED